MNFVGRNNGIADESAPIIWSQEFSGRVNYLPTCVTEAKYVINLANLKGHSYGITLCGKNHFGSFINGNAMRPPEGANLHQWLTRDEMGIYSPLVDLMSNADLGGKTVLYMLDALICAPSEGSSITKENATWQQEPFNGGYTASVFVSQDPVAIDSVGADFLSNEPTVKDYNRAAASMNNENYLHEAGLVGNAPSGTRCAWAKKNGLSQAIVPKVELPIAVLLCSGNLRTEQIDITAVCRSLWEYLGSPVFLRVWDRNILPQDGIPGHIVHSVGVKTLSLVHGILVSGKNRIRELG